VGIVLDRAALAEFLRRRREELRPADVGLPESARRRTPGLRREEVAVIAGLSSDYYARLEQGRGSDPSESVIGALARALHCAPDERDHLFRLAGFPVPARQVSTVLDAGLRQLAESLDHLPVCVYNDFGDVLFTNALDDALHGRDAMPSGPDGNLYRSWFLHPDLRERVVGTDWQHLSAAHVRDLRASYARHDKDPEIGRLVAELAERSPEFRALWDRHEVAVRRTDVKRLEHPQLGLLKLRCQVMEAPDSGVRMRIYLPVEGTDAAAKLDLLRMIGNRGAQGHAEAAADLGLTERVWLIHISQRRRARARAVIKRRPGRP
jgi:transcriptional regulator with XRE-family HTH domain